MSFLECYEQMTDHLLKTGCLKEALRIKWLKLRTEWEG